MTATPGRLLGNAMLALSTAGDHWRDDPVVLALQITRRLPPAVRAAIGSAGDRLSETGPIVPVAVALAAGGRTRALRELLQERVHRARTRGVDPDDRVRRADVAHAADLPDLADELLSSTAPATVGWRAARARVHWYHGRMQQAVAVLRRSGREGAVRDRLASEVRALEGALPSLPPQPGYRAEADRVLFVLTNSLPHTGSGYAQRSHSLMAAVRDEGWQVEAVTRLGWPVQTGVLTAAAQDEVDGIVYHRLLTGRLVPGFDARLQQHAEHLLELVLERRPAVLHTTTHWVNAVVVAAVAHAVGIPWVYEVRGQLADTWASNRGPRALESERYRRFVRREQDAVLAADAVVTLAETMRARLVEGGADPERIVLSPNAVGGAFLQEPGAAREARESLGLDPDGEYVGTVSSVVPYEGLDDLVRAVALLAPDRPRLRLLIAGDGTALPGLQQLADELGIADRLVCLGRVDRSLAPVCHRALDVFCVPRKDTTVTRAVTPMKPLEAMASARTVVVSDLPALREVVDDGRTGLVSPAEDPEALASCLGGLLDDPLRREEIGRRARAWVLEERTWAANARRYVRTYAQITARPAPSGR